MKKIVFIIAFFTVLPLMAQHENKVGIDTDKPVQLLHIDANKDNRINAANSKDDVVISDAGNVGVGIHTPQNRLHISADGPYKAFRLVDTSQGAGNVLTVIDDSGNAAWRPMRRAKTAPSANAGAGFSGSVNSDMAYIHRYVDLEPGLWMIRSNILLNVQGSTNYGTPSKGFYARFSWAESNGAGGYTLTPDAVFGNEIGGQYILENGIAQGQTIINNTSGTTKRYYLVTRTPTFWGGYNTAANWNKLGGYWGEMVCIAYPAT